MAEFGNLPTIEPVVEKLDGKTVVTLGTVHFTEGNAAVRAALEDADVVELRETFAQRYLGCGMPVGKRLEIHGVPGNDMACYMDGGEIEVFGNAQDQVANTMNDGDIVFTGAWAMLRATACAAAAFWCATAAVGASAFT